MIRVLIVEDSVTARKLLAGIFGGRPGMTVVGEARNGLEGVELAAKLRPDVVTMDLRMPVLDGLEATRRIMAATPTPVVVISSADPGDVKTSMAALQAGALAVLEKPEGPGAPDFRERCESLLRTVELMAGVKVVRRHESLVARRAPPVPAPAPAPAGMVRVVAIVASTGGPAALQAILSSLPPDFPSPVLIVQHIARGFVGGLVTWLASESRLRVKLAEHGERASPGVAYVAPDDCQLGITRDGRLQVGEGTPAAFRPSGSFLFEAVAAAFGAGVVAVILTGMGRDGVDGLRRVRAAGGRVLAQDEASSVVFGMPGAAVEAGLADEVVALDAIAGRLQALAGA